MVEEVQRLLTKTHMVLQVLKADCSIIRLSSLVH